ncbi:MAG: ComEC/Rec2 family competence protein [Oscillospiraceae bacterium]|nr:ComEC/Rec2 family competence protein [Oscillospiraceae bacterium]
MKRKMVGASAAYMSGLFFASFITGGSELLLTAVMLPVFFTAAYFIKMKKSDIIMLTVFFIAAVCAEASYTHFVYDRITSCSGETGSFTGTLTDVEFYKGENACYTLKGSIDGVQKARIVYFGESRNVSIGDTISLEECTFEIPESDYLFNGENYYKAENIFLEAKEPKNVCFERDESFILRRSLMNYREKIIDKFYMSLDVREANLLTAIVFGEKGGLDDTDRTLMYRSGIGHVMAVSGLHVSVMAAVLMVLLKKLRINRYVSFIIMNILIMLMIIMVKSPVSALRAFLMLDFVYSAQLFRRQNDTLNSLSAAALIICISNPFSVLSCGFLLSLSGTFGIGVFAPYMTAKMKNTAFFQKLAKAFVSMLCVMLTIMPLNIYWFGEASVISPVTNIIAAPFCVGAMIIGMIYVLTGGVVSGLSLSGVLLKIVLFMTDNLGKLTFSAVSFSHKNSFITALLLSLLIIIGYALFRSRKITAFLTAGAVLVMYLSAGIVGIIQADTVKIAVLGRNANAAVVIIHKGQACVYDLSGHYKAPQYVKKYLTAEGCDKVKFVVLTKKAASQLTAYEGALELFDTECFCMTDTSADSSLFGENVLASESSGFKSSDEACTAKYNSGILWIECRDNSFCAIPVGMESSGTADIEVHYSGWGRTEGVELILRKGEGSTALRNEELNNFEISFPSEGGEYRIRRL